MTTMTKKAAAAEEVTERYVLWAMGGGLIPVPFLDLAAIVGTQIKMLAEISEIYEVPFSENRAKMIILPLISSVGLAPAGLTLLGSLSKVVPIVGQAIGGIAMPVFAGGVTLATSRVFVAHFESGGTLLDFKTEQAKVDFHETFSASKSALENARTRLRLKNLSLSELTVDGEPILPGFFERSAAKVTEVSATQTPSPKSTGNPRVVKKKVLGKKKRSTKKKVPPFRRSVDSDGSRPSKSKVANPKVDKS